MWRRIPTKKSLFPMGKGHFFIYLAALLLYAALVQPAAADVEVYAEGAYDETSLDLYIYADIDQAILSYGIRVNYPASLLTATDSAKNNDVWYFGEDSPGYDYMSPENDGSSVVIIGGKLDTDEPTAGVTGNRVLLGRVSFSHSSVTDFSGITLTYGRGDGSSAYKNFVETDGAVLDGTASLVFSNVLIAERGDANHDGAINSIDAQYVSSIFFGSTPWTVLADCNGDGDVDSIDAQCISQKFFNP